MYKTKIGDEGREMVQIPEGPFTMGSNDGDPDEAPEHQVYLKGFYLDQKEVTQEEYMRFAKMTKRAMPRIEVFDDDQSKILKPELAAMSVSWDEAAAYCKWPASDFRRKRSGEGRSWRKQKISVGNESSPTPPMWMAVRMGINILLPQDPSMQDGVPTACMT